MSPVKPRGRLSVAICNSAGSAGHPGQREPSARCCVGDDVHIDVAGLPDHGGTDPRTGERGTYAAAREGAIKSAKDLYGIGSLQCQGVAASFSAIAVPAGLTRC